MKKKFTLHLDAICVLALLFIVLIGLVVFQQFQISALTADNEALQWKGVENSFNLDSQQVYINKLKKQINEK